MRMNDLRKATEIIDAAIDHGINYLNTGDFYGHGESEMVIREVLKTHKREDVFISVKFGGMLTPCGQFYGIDVRPQAVQNYLAYTLKRLGTDYVDLYQTARINPHIPVETPSVLLLIWLRLMRAILALPKLTECLSFK